MPIIDGIIVAPDETRSAPASNTSSVVGITLNSPGVICPSGYHRLMDAPEVAAAVWRIADMLGSMTIHLMRNTDAGDVRVRDELAKKVDVSPWSLTTRSSWVSWIATQMLTEGEAFVLPVTSGGRLDDLIPQPSARTQLRPDGKPYEIVINGVAFDPDEVLHFILRPDPRYPWKGVGPRLQLQAVVDSIMQTNATKQAYMSSDYKPPIIISVNADSDLSDEDLRSRFLEKFWKRNDPTEPVVIPADLMNVTQAKYLSLTDLAIKDGVELDKKAVASIFGVPGFLVGVGQYIRQEYNTFVSTVLMPLAKRLEQELTKKLLLSPDRYFRFSSRALYAYDLQEMANIGDAQYVRGIMTGNEVRDWLGLSPMKGLDELVLLENYIPLADIGNQEKLQGGNDNGED
jgi:HK97 family phage portal protein